MADRLGATPVEIGRFGKVFEDEEPILAVASTAEGLIAVSRKGRVAVLDAAGLVVARPLDRGTIEGAGIAPENCDRVVLDAERGLLAVARGIDREARGFDCQAEHYPRTDPVAIAAADRQELGDFGEHPGDLVVGLWTLFGMEEFPRGTTLSRCELSWRVRPTNTRRNSKPKPKPKPTSKNSFCMMKATTSATVATPGPCAAKDG